MTTETWLKGVPIPRHSLSPKGCTFFFSANELFARQKSDRVLRPFHTNPAFVLMYDFAGAECRRQIADNFANVQTGPIRS